MLNAIKIVVCIPLVLVTILAAIPAYIAYYLSIGLFNFMDFMGGLIESIIATTHED